MNDSMKKIKAAITARRAQVAQAREAWLEGKLELKRKKNEALKQLAIEIMKDSSSSKGLDFNYVGIRHSILLETNAGRLSGKALDLVNEQISLCNQFADILEKLTYNKALLFSQLERENFVLSGEHIKL